MRIGLLTREWPPEVYGGAGVHVDYLVRELRRLVDVDVHCFGASRDGAHGHGVPPSLESANPALQTMGVDLEMVQATAGVDLLHSHTWYANFAGQVGSLLHGVPHVLTAHSLEPRRPWKAEQLGGGFRVSSWVERTAYADAAAVIAVSDGMRADILDVYPDVDPACVHVVHNGVDTQAYCPDPATDALHAYGIDPHRPYVLFVGRITRQKGIIHLLRAALDVNDDVALVLCASAPDTPEISAETDAAVAAVRAARGPDSVVWIREHLPRPAVVQLLTHALAFVCPSVYEPLGIVNLEAMACETAVVASAVGGIPEVVIDGVTGILVAYDAHQPSLLESGIAAGINRLAANPDLARSMGQAGRMRAVEHFGWDAIAQRTLAVYESVL